MSKRRKATIRRHLLLSALLVGIAASSGVIADILIDRFDEPNPRKSTEIEPSVPYTRPSGQCTELGQDADPANPCMYHIGTNPEILGGERDTFAAVLGIEDTLALEIRIGPNPVKPEQTSFLISSDGDITSYVRIEWDGEDGKADDSWGNDADPSASVTNKLKDLTDEPMDEENPFYTRDSVDNTDEFFGSPRMSESSPISGGLDNDEYDGKLDHSTVDKIRGLGGLDLTQGNGGTEGDLQLLLDRADLSGSFRFTVYSGEDEGSFFRGEFPPGQVREILAPLAGFEAIPGDPTGRSNPSSYEPADFTSVTAIVFEILTFDAIDIGISSVSMIVTPAPSPSSALLMVSGCILLLALRFRSASRG